MTAEGAMVKHVEVELGGRIARAQSIVDMDNLSKCTANTWLICDVNSDQLMRAFKSITDE